MPAKDLEAHRDALPVIDVCRMVKRSLKYAG
jgi:hypothetical protein